MELATPEGFDPKAFAEGVIRYFITGRNIMYNKAQMENMAVYCWFGIVVGEIASWAAEYRYGWDLGPLFVVGYRRRVLICAANGQIMGTLS